MKDLAPNNCTRKSPALILVLVILPLITLGLYVVPNLLDTTPPALSVSGLERDNHYRGALTLDSIGGWWFTG